MDKRNKTALAYLLIGVAAAGRALLAVPENAAIQEVSLTVLALVGYLLLASKTRLPTVFGAAGLVLELILCGSQDRRGVGTAGPGAARGRPVAVLGRGARAGAAGRAAAKQNAVHCRRAAGRLHRHALYPVADLRRRRQLCGVQRRHALVCGHYDPRLQRRAHKKIRRFCANPFRDKVTNTANCVILNTIIKIQPEGRLLL